MQSQNQPSKQDKKHSGGEGRTKFEKKEGNQYRELHRSGGRNPLQTMAFF